MTVIIQTVNGSCSEHQARPGSATLLVGRRVGIDASVFSSQERTLGQLDQGGPNFPNTIWNSNFTGVRGQEDCCPFSYAHTHTHYRYIFECSHCFGCMLEFLRRSRPRRPQQAGLKRSHWQFGSEAAFHIFHGTPTVLFHPYLYQLVYRGFLKWWYSQIIHFSRVFGFPLKNHPFWGTPMTMEPPIW